MKNTKKVSITVPICGWAKKEIEVPENATLEECFDVFMDKIQNVELFNKSVSDEFLEASIDYMFETGKGNVTYLDVNQAYISEMEDEWNFEDEDE